jgi:hypothetical protein
MSPHCLDEAGHVCAAYWGGLPIRGATIVPTLLANGHASVGHAHSEVEDALPAAAEATVLYSAIPLRARRLLEADAIMTEVRYSATLVARGRRAAISSGESLRHKVLRPPS